MSALDYIREQGTCISCDTMDTTVAKNFHGKKYINATSNQRISHAALSYPEHQGVLEQSARDVLAAGTPEEKQADAVVYRAMGKIGRAMLSEIDGAVLTQTAPSNAFDAIKTAQNARDLVAAFELEGVPRERLIIKVPSTWEGLQACKILAEEGISTLGTMIFTLVQAIVAANSNCKAISPYVNSFNVHLNPHKWAEKYNVKRLQEQPGVANAVAIHEYYRSHGVKHTRHIPAGLFNVDEAIALAGVDEFTLPKHLLDPLAELKGFEARSLLKDVEVGSEPVDHVSEAEFRWRFNTDPDAVRNLADALNAFYEYELKLVDEAKQALEKVKAE